MLLDFLFRIFRRMSGWLQWRMLWLLNDKFMLSVAGVISDEAGRVLLLRHRYWVPEVWGLPGGIVYSGETLEEAFTREVFEETGLELEGIELLRVVSGYRMRLEVLFKARLADGIGAQPIRLQAKEVLEAQFFAPDELPPDMLPVQREVIEGAP